MFEWHALEGTPEGRGWQGSYFAVDPNGPKRSSKIVERTSITSVKWLASPGHREIDLATQASEASQATEAESDILGQLASGLVLQKAAYRVPFPDAEDGF